MTPVIFQTLKLRYNLPITKIQVFFFYPHYAELVIAPKIKQQYSLSLI